MLTALLLVLAPLALTPPGAVAGGPRPVGPDGGPPARLSETGLYVDIASRRLDAANLPYSPQYALWSDGAEKRRWIRLPPGTWIDASDPEVWKFPVGTRIWKEFAWGGKPVETRMLLRSRAGWRYATYVWNEAGTDAELAPAGGIASRHEVAPRRPHLIPSVSDCKNCHQGGRSEVLGFGALQLSPDRDPLAPHAEALPAGAVDLRALVDRGLLSGLPRELLQHPPRIASDSPRGRAALGYLHANCGGCHDSAGPVASVGLTLRHDLMARSPEAEPAALAVDHESSVGAPGAPAGESFWLRPGAPSRSTVLTRMASRNPAVQMPPLGTQLVDADAVALITAWIAEDLGPPPDRR